MVTFTQIPQTIFVVQFSSVAQSCPTLCDPMNPSTSGLPVHHQLLEFTQTHVHPVGDAISHLILCHPLLPLPPIPPNIRGFSNESTLQMMWPKYWSSASASVLPMNIQDWFPLGWTGWISLQFKGRLLQHHSLKASVIWHSAFFIVQLLHPYMTTGKTIALTRPLLAK